MTGLLILLFLALCAVAVMRLAGLRGPMLTMAAAALMLGGAGYALQGKPWLRGSPRAGSAAQAPISLVGARERFFGRFYNSEHWLLMADSFAQRGDTQNEVKIIQSGLRQHPRDYALWTGLGNAIADHASGITPAAEFAFAKAKEYAPTAPAPDYFWGLAKLRSGDFAGASSQWKELLARSPAEAQWRPMVEDGVRLADALEAQQRAQTMSTPAR